MAEELKETKKVTKTTAAKKPTTTKSTATKTATTKTTTKKALAKKVEAKVEPKVVEKVEVVAEKPKTVAKKEQKKIRVTLVKSFIGYKYDQKRTVKALGLNKINSTNELVDNPCVRGMINKIKHIVRVDELN